MKKERIQKIILLESQHRQVETRVYGYGTFLLYPLEKVYNKRHVEDSLFVGMKNKNNFESDIR